MKLSKVYGRLTRGSAKPAKTDSDDLSPDDIIIAVMGPAGSGKSTFINIITGLETANVGHDLGLCTKEVEKFRHSLPGLAYGDLVFVDTPGFDYMSKSDLEVLKMVDNWLKSTYGKDMKLSGLLYFHRISDIRLAGTSLKYIGMFEELCGKKTLQNVILTTTMWDDVDQETGESREGELRSSYWLPMLDRDSTTNRFRKTRESAFTVIDPLIETANIRFSALLQQELTDMRRKLSSTSRATGRELLSTMELLLRQREDLLRRIRNEIKRRADNEMILEPLQDEYQKLKTNMESTINDMRRLKIPLGKRLVKMTDKFFSNHDSNFTFKLFMVAH